MRFGNVGQVGPLRSSISLSCTDFKDESFTVYIFGAQDNFAERIL